MLCLYLLNFCLIYLYSCKKLCCSCQWGMLVAASGPWMHRGTNKWRVWKPEQDLSSLCHINIYILDIELFKNVFSVITLNPAVLIKQEKKMLDNNLKNMYKLHIMTT